MTTNTPDIAPEPHFAPSGRILKRDDVLVLGEVDALMEATRKRVASVQNAARERFEYEIRAGVEEGARKGAEEKARIVAETAARADDVLNGLEGEIAALAADVVERIVGELDDRDLVYRLARQAVGRLRDEKRITLYVAPEMSAPLERDLGRYLASIGREDLVKIASDERLARRDCVMSSEVGWVDLSLEAQMRALRAGLERANGESGE